jgi:hypothetical protein
MVTSEGAGRAGLMAPVPPRTSARPDGGAAAFSVHSIRAESQEPSDEFTPRKSHDATNDHRVRLRSPLRR